MRLSLHSWIRISLFNLLFLSAIGVTLRYKIAFALPFIDQKHLLHSHSHFAFAGWIGQALMSLLVAYLPALPNGEISKKYNWLLFLNLFTAYGMLVSFFMEGYGPVSIFFSTFSVFVSYAFSIVYWKDLNKTGSKNISHAWFKVALLCNALSSLGAYALALMMVNRIVHQNWYLAAEYFYLHFQYNGWFFFSCMGLFTAKLVHKGIPQEQLKKVFWLFAAAIVPAYFLSVLWMNFSIWIYVIIVIAAVAQVIGWARLLSVLNQHRNALHTFSKAAGWLLKLSAIALSIKLLLQLGSVIPSLSDLSYGFRPIIIGYLHLVLLGIITIFILGYMVAEQQVSINRMTLTGLSIFVAGIVLNEIFLMFQGVWAMSYNSIPFINETLFFITFVMFSGLALINISQIKK